MTSDGNTIAVPAAEVQALAAALTDRAAEAEEAGTRLATSTPLGPSLAAAAEHFLSCHHAAAGAFAGELRWLGATIADVAISWTELDDGLLAPAGRAVPR